MTIVIGTPKAKATNEIKIDAEDYNCGERFRLATWVAHSVTDVNSILGGIERFLEHRNI